jgi:hypothetical protein
MVYEERTYTLHPGTTPAFLREYQEHGMRVHQRYLGEQVGFFTTDVGILTQIVQIFAFTNPATGNDGAKLSMRTQNGWRLCPFSRATYSIWKIGS